MTHQHFCYQCHHEFEGEPYGIIVCPKCGYAWIRAIQPTRKSA